MVQPVDGLVMLRVFAAALLLRCDAVVGFFGRNPQIGLDANLEMLEETRSKPPTRDGLGLDWPRVAAAKFHAYPGYGLAPEGRVGIQGDHPGAI